MLFFALVLIMSACQMGDSPEKEMLPSQEHTDNSFKDKNVVMIILDSMMGSTVDKSIKEGQVPAFTFLINHGQYYKDIVSPFPSMSVNIESTMITGEMSDKHRVPGLSWYDQDKDRIVNYGTTWKTWLKNGVSKGIYDVFYHLNNTHLNPNVSTIFEDLEKRGFTTGAINTLVYRGDHVHHLTLPVLADELTDLPQSIQTKGPNVLGFGRFAKPETLEQENFTDGIFHRLGLQDKYTMEVTQKLIEQGDQPNFLMIFFPENDQEVHKNSPHYRRGMERAEDHVQGILNAYDNWEEALEENIFIILGDHGQDHMVEDEEEVAIDLDHLYEDFEISPLGEPVSKGDIAFGVNQRMSYVYDVHDQKILPLLAQRAKKDARIKLSAWREDEWIKVISPDQEGTLRFKPGGEWTDRYDQAWTFEGNIDILTLKTDPDKRRIMYVDYPDVLNQLYTALDSHDVPKLILAAKPGHSFLAESISIHPNGGEHGGLHKNDVLAAMIIAGTDQEPEYHRMVDLKNYIERLVTKS
ncbi:alkaline phosphatase family protein [Alteribacillus sp. JSM 102045]|uniref:alkaline phosphatase family protein n=1 Tax=Alteribacillus sp. JSM 102045 TaxID=1562101 RepID=UPI0035BFEE1A